MNPNGRMTEQLSIGVSFDLKERLKNLALTQHRSLAGTVRVLLEEAMELEDTLRPSNPDRSEYEIRLTTKQAARLVKKGYIVQAWEPQYTQLGLL
jgi:hypothetical protein